jgi:hypothetical protein
MIVHYEIGWDEENERAPVRMYTRGSQGSEGRQRYFQVSPFRVKRSVIVANFKARRKRT